MASEFVTIFEALKPVLTEHAGSLAVKTDTPSIYLTTSKAPSPFPQHKGHPLDFGMIKIGKAYVSFHLLPLYMNPELQTGVPPELKKRMQGKACFNFKSVPDDKLLADLRNLTATGIETWRKIKWL